MQKPIKEIHETFSRLLSSDKVEDDEIDTNKKKEKEKEDVKKKPKDDAK
jgi:hypothetical protein